MNELNFTELERMESSDMSYQEVLLNEASAAHPSWFVEPEAPDDDDWDDDAEDESEDSWYDDNDDWNDEEED